MDVQKQLDDLKVEVDSCYACNFGRTCTQKVFGEGSLGVSIMSVSEAPGAEEDAVGRPYVGRAGKFWESMLAAVGWNRAHIYTCNALKCRPPNNKIPDGFYELNTCKNFLLKQVALIQPKMILVFGKPAAYALGFLRKTEYNSAVKEKLGLQKELYQYVGLDGWMKKARILWTYHPSYLMSKPDGRNYCFEVYKQMREAKEALEVDLHGMDRGQVR